MYEVWFREVVANFSKPSKAADGDHLQKLITYLEMKPTVSVMAVTV